MKVVSLGERNGNAKSFSVRDSLAQAVADVDSGKRTATKCAVLFLDDTNGGYLVGFHQSGMSMSELVALIEVLKHEIIANEMGVGRNLSA